MNRFTMRILARSDTLKFLYWRVWFKVRWFHTDVYAFWQRGRRGWADKDTWGLDHYLSRVIADSLDYLAAHGHGVPSESWLGSDGDGKPWADELHRIAAAFRRYVEDDDTAETAEQMTSYYESIPTLKQDMHALIDHWESLWD